MTIEITLDDLVHLTETARSNGHSVLYMTKTTDGKRCSLIITSTPRRKRTRKGLAQAALNQES